MFRVHSWFEFDCVCAAWITNRQNYIKFAINVTIRRAIPKMIHDTRLKGETGSMIESLSDL
mgnify:CR=1 FL=1